MKIIICKNYEELSSTAANLIKDQIISKKDSVLGLATGSSPLKTYEKLVDLYKNNLLDFSEIKSVNLDEYKGLTKDNTNSYYFFMKENFFNKINIKEENINIPNGMALDELEECENYEEKINSLGGIDLQLLGIGHNGHIAFNEPASHFSKKTHCVELSESTIKANSRFFETEDEVPKKAFTMGIGTIFKAKKIILIASGKDKAKIIKEAFFSEVNPNVPASILQFHKDVIIILDEDAASLINKF